MFTIYSKPGCANCEKSKQLLASKNLEFVEHILDTGQPKDQNIEYYTVDQLQRLVPGARTVPQIFGTRDGKTELIGGFEALRKYLD